MASKPFIYPYKNSSRSALALAQGLGGLVIKHENSKFRASDTKSVVNWGASKLPVEWENTGIRVLNHPATTARATNKLSFFEDMKAAGVKVPRFTTSREEAKGWLANGTKMIFARTILTGHSGAGIIVVENAATLDTIPDGTLLVEYVPKRDEFRIHAKRDGTVFDIQQKKRKVEVADADVNFKIRNIDNGFIYARNEIAIPEKVSELAKQAALASSLDFGAFDIVYNARHDEAYLLEVNTAPGLSGSTVENYVKMVKGYYGQQ